MSQFSRMYVPRPWFRLIRSALRNNKLPLSELRYKMAIHFRSVFASILLSLLPAMHLSLLPRILLAWNVLPPLREKDGKETDPPRVRSHKTHCFSKVSAPASYIHPLSKKPAHLKYSIHWRFFSRVVVVVVSSGQKRKCCRRRR